MHTVQLLLSVITIIFTAIVVPSRIYVLTYQLRRLQKFMNESSAMLQKPETFTMSFAETLKALLEQTHTESKKSLIIFVFVALSNAMILYHSTSTDIDGLKIMLLFSSLLILIVLVWSVILHISFKRSMEKTFVTIDRFIALKRGSAR